MTDTSAQNRAVLDWLRDHGTITQRQAALSLGVWRLSARVMELKQAGHCIDMERITVRSRYGRAVVARYRLVTVKKKGGRGHPTGSEAKA